MLKELFEDGNDLISFLFQVSVALQADLLNCADWDMYTIKFPTL